jgi:hypothetical protein
MVAKSYMSVQRVKPANRTAPLKPTDRLRLNGIVLEADGCDDSLQLQAEGLWSDAGVSSQTVVRFMHKSERCSKQLLPRMACADVWYVSAFTQANA